MQHSSGVEITSCDLEPIHIPGSIQPYGTLLIAEPSTDIVVGYAGQVDGSPLSVSLKELIGISASALLSKTAADGVYVLGHVTFNGQPHDAVCYQSGAHVAVELIPRADDAVLDVAYFSHFHGLETRIERASTIADLAREAAAAFHELTGYGRVMVYRFIEDDAGVVVGEYTADNLSSFMNHHFPATDIPKQARALYVRNKVRVIADVHYEPQPIISASSELKAFDLSDSTLRSVSPTHIQYLKNMGVGASASMSIIKDGQLWGLIACHHHEPRMISLNTRMACQSLATTLARLIKTREESEFYQQRIRLRAQEDAILNRLGSDGNIGQFFERSGVLLAKMLNADGFAAVQGGELFSAGHCPAPAQIKAVAELYRVSALMKPLSTRSLSQEFAPAEAFRDTGSGVIAVTMSTEVPTIMLWFRGEALQTVKWAGNPHKDAPAEANVPLSPRASFEMWAEEVKGRSRSWSLAEIESASRVARLLLDARNNSRIRQLNQDLTTTARENESLLRQKDFLLREVNHRVQNSLSIVASFLRMQSRGASEEAKAELEQAERRLMAVSLAHRRLYQDESVEVIDLSRYLEELMAELIDAFDEGWQSQVRLDLAPVLIQTDRAVSIGLMLNELMTNLAKYAYEGKPGPVIITLVQAQERLRLSVADSGRGMSGDVAGTGFGSKMLHVLMQRLGGKLEYEDNRPGTKAIIIAPIGDS